ncbi:MAG: hypothetical protein PHZ04_02295 [Patescibacteria group bacterium]|nr:hypothetical protein [Patescibacteria group bacterium]MDD5294324.1 hypothetical protein [Patescibacteria group bacterium]MDD5554147.1 hypothetical protein [Patescibacteria group bacterium]
MRNKIFIIVVFVLILIVGLSIGWSLGRGKPGGDSYLGQNGNGGESQESVGAAQEDETLNKDGFSVMMPRGWKEVTAPTGVSAMVANAGEEISDPSLQKINFKSYYSVSYDALGERTIEEYINYIKDMVKQFAPGIVFSSEEDLNINGREAHKIEADLNQQGADFKVLIFLIRGNGSDIWNMSFNSGLGNWEKNAGEFKKIAESFIIK